VLWVSCKTHLSTPQNYPRNHTLPHGELVEPRTATALPRKRALRGLALYTYHPNLSPCGRMRIFLGLASLLNPWKIQVRGFGTHNTLSPLWRFPALGQGAKMLESLSPPQRGEIIDIAHRAFTGPRPDARPKARSKGWRACANRNGAS